MPRRVEAAKGMKIGGSRPRWIGAGHLTGLGFTQRLVNPGYRNIAHSRNARG